MNTLASSMSLLKPATWKRWTIRTLLILDQIEARRESEMTKYHEKSRLGDLRCLRYPDQGAEENPDADGL